MVETPGLQLELGLWEKGLTRIAGVDEAGRGAWAGPVMAGAVILPKDAHIRNRLEGVRDSKQMSARQRERWAKEIQCAAKAWAVGATNWPSLFCRSA